MSISGVENISLTNSIVQVMRGFQKILFFAKNIRENRYYIMLFADYIEDQEREIEVWRS